MSTQVDGLLIIGIEAVCTINMHYIFKGADIKHFFEDIRVKKIIVYSIINIT